MSQDTEADVDPSDNERAKFFLDQKFDHLTPMEVLGSMDGDTAEQNLEAIAFDFYEGIQRLLQNKRELGWSPVNVWNTHVKVDWPEWVKVSLAESEHQAFEGDPEFMSEEEKEYVEFLEDTYDVPR